MQRDRASGRRLAPHHRELDPCALGRLSQSVTQLGDTGGRLTGALSVLHVLLGLEHREKMIERVHHLVAARVVA
jgi:hypothetical protein